MMMKKILFAFLFVLTATTAAFSANPTSVQTTGGVIAITPCNESNCDTLPQYQTREYKSIKGTIYSSDPRAGNVQNFPYRVRVTYKSDNGIHSYTSIVQPTFGFVIPAGDAGRGTVTFTVIDDRADAEYEVLTFNTNNFDSENGKSIVMKKKTATTPTRNTAPAASAGGTGTKVTGDTKPFTAYLIYDTSNKSRSGISGATVTDVNTGKSAQTGRGGKFTLECLFTTKVNKEAGSKNIERLRPDLEDFARKNGMSNPSAYATRIINENIAALDEPKTTPECFLLFAAKNQEKPYSVTVNINDQNKYLVYRDYKRNSSSTRNQSGGTSASPSSVSPANQGAPERIKIEGYVYLEGSDTGLQSVQLSPKGASAITAMASNSVATSDENGHFIINEFPKNFDLVAKFYTMDGDVTIPYADIENNPTGLAIYIPERNPIAEEKDFVPDATHIDDSACTGNEKKKEELFAKTLKWVDTDKYAGGSTDEENRIRKCVPESCIKGYTLENENKENAFCKQCKKEDIQFARKVKVRENKCILDGDNACESGYAPNSDFTQCVEICNDDAKRNLEGANGYKVKDGQCVATSCECGYTLDDGTCKKWDENEKCTRNGTPKLPNDATDAIKKCDSDGTPYCEITDNGCKPGYKPSDDKRTCIQQTGKDCTEEIKNDNPLVKTAKWELRNNELVCAIISCTDGFDVDKVNNKCIPEDQTGKPCPDNLMPDNAKRAIVSDQDVTEASKCEVKSCNDGYIPAKENANDTYFTRCIPDCGCLERFNESQTKCEQLVDKSCLITNAKEAQLVCENGKEVCKIMNDSCEEGFRANTTNTKCESLKNEKCEIEKTDTNNADQIKTAKYEMRNGKMVCIITSCNDLYKPSVDGQSCVNTQCECGQEWDNRSRSCVPWKKQTCTMKHATKTNRTCEDGNEVCKIIECDTAAGYVLNPTNNSCDSIKNDPCSDDQIRAVEHAVAGKQQVQNGKIVCVVTDCGDLHTPSADGSSCRPKPMLTEQQHREKIGALSENAQKMRENETSLKNRIIGAAGIGVTGIGGAMVGDALSSRAAELSAEQDMAAYLQSMYCEYGDGKTIRGGETGVELPGGNDMIDLYTQYAQLANDLKIRKDALGIRPGIESEVVIDKAETGLYDDVGTGITGGTYASIARALLYPDGPDAAKWAQMRAATDNKLKAGAIVAGVGAVGSGVANLIANRDSKDNTDEIVRKYEALRKPFEDLQRHRNNAKTERTCPSDSSGTYPNCTCQNSNSYYNTEQGCVTCDSNSNLVPNASRTACVCKDGYVPAQNDPDKCAEKNDDKCTLTGDIIQNDDGSCECMKGATQTSNVCKCPYGTENNACKVQETSLEQTPVPQVKPGEQIATVTLTSDNMFNSGKWDILPSAQKDLDDFKSNATQAAKKANINLRDPDPNYDYCVIIVGKTDHQGFTAAAKKRGLNNQVLSVNRANAVKDEFSELFLDNHIITYGIADQDCPATPIVNPKCRVVTATLVAGSCDNVKKSALNILNKIQGISIPANALQIN